MHLEGIFFKVFKTLINMRIQNNDKYCDIYFDRALVALLCLVCCDQGSISHVCMIQSTTNTVKIMYSLLHFSSLVLSCVSCKDVCVAASLPDFQNYGAGRGSERVGVKKINGVQMNLRQHNINTSTLTALTKIEREKERKEKWQAI